MVSFIVLYCGEVCQDTRMSFRRQQTADDFYININQNNTGGARSDGVTPAMTGMRSVIAGACSILISDSSNPAITDGLNSSVTGVFDKKNIVSKLCCEWLCSPPLMCEWTIYTPCTKWVCEKRVTLKRCVTKISRNRKRNNVICFFSFTIRAVRKPFVSLMQRYKKNSVPQNQHYCQKNS